MRRDPCSSKTVHLGDPGHPRTSHHTRETLEPWEHRGPNLTLSILTHCSHVVAPIQTWTLGRQRSCEGHQGPPDIKKESTEHRGALSTC